MKSILKLTNPLWQTSSRRTILDKVVQQSGLELESRIKQKILDGPKSGKLYRRGAIKKRIASRDLGFYRSNRRVFKRTFTGLYAEKTTVEYQFHRASKRGESPASDTGALLNSIKTRGVSSLRVRVSSSKVYASILDDKRKLNRPFFENTAEEFKEKFKANIQKAIDEMK